MAERPPDGKRHGRGEGAGVERTGDGPVVVATSGSRLEAMFAVTALEDAGHAAVLLSDDAGGLHPEMGYLYGGAYRVAVPAEDAEAALAYLAELDAGEHAIGTDASPDGTEEGGRAGVGLDGRRRGWAILAVAVAVVFVLFRLLDSAASFGWF